MEIGREQWHPLVTIGKRNTSTCHNFHDIVVKRWMVNFKCYSTPPSSFITSIWPLSLQVWWRLPHRCGIAPHSLSSLPQQLTVHSNGLAQNYNEWGGGRVNQRWVRIRLIMFCTCVVSLIVVYCILSWIVNAVWCACMFLEALKCFPTLLCSID